MKRIILPFAGILSLFIIFMFCAVYSTKADGNLLAYWKLDETTAGSTAVDSSGNSYDGTPHGSPQPSTDVPSTINFSDPESLGFNGSQWVSIPNNSAFAMTSATFSVWVKFTNLSAGDMDMIAKRSGDGSQAQWQFGYNGGTNQFKVSLANGGSSCCTDYHYSPSGGISANTWYNIAVSIDNSTHQLKWYQDGVLKQTDDITGTNLGTAISADLTLGASYDGTSEFLQGYLDDVRIYNTALDSTQISDIAAGNSGPGIPSATSTPNPTPILTSNSVSLTSNSSGSSPAPICGDAKPASEPDLFQLRAKKNSVTLYFAPDSGANSSYYIGYGFDTTAQNFGTTFNYTNGGGVIAYTVNALFPGTWYFKVRGQNGCMPGEWSRVMKVQVSNSGAKVVNAMDK